MRPTFKVEREDIWIIPLLLIWLVIVLYVYDVLQ